MNSPRRPGELGKLENTMNAKEIISQLKDEMEFDLHAVAYALEDGAALEAIGLSDDDQEAVEEAHTLIKAEILWKQGKNIWEISQLCGIAESEVNAYVYAL
jgi:hypothetical protein